jgi:hypothetical protein
MSGVLDIFVAVPAGAHHGLWIEMKLRSNELTPEQSSFAQRVAQRRYAVFVAYSWKEALAIWCAYLGLELPPL